VFKSIAEKIPNCWLSGSFSKCAWVKGARSPVAACAESMTKRMAM
jgi:hypothetical protein